MVRLQSTMAEEKFYLSGANLYCNSGLPRDLKNFKIKVNL